MDNFHGAEDSTPIDDISGLIPGHISTKKELDVWEAENVLHAVSKYLSKKTAFELSEKTIKGVHKEMFGATWKWAGAFRRKVLNIGIAPEQIGVEIKKLIDDSKYWSENKMQILEQAVRIHHRLVMIHPFENGNGRHARLVSDIILFTAGHAMPKWPDKDMVDNTDIRKEYIKALKEADKGDFDPLMKFTDNLI
jgi:Fic-DOC domain mobile mystery protein B